MADKSIYQKGLECYLWAASVYCIFFAYDEIKKILAHQRTLKLLHQLKEDLKQNEEDLRHDEASYVEKKLLLLEEFAEKI